MKFYVDWASDRWDEVSIEKEFNSLEELKEFANKENRALIIRFNDEYLKGANSIIVYDDYIE